MLKEALEIGVHNNIEGGEKRSNGKGIAFVIVGFDPSRNGENITQLKLWTNLEKKSKPPTGRIAGQISFPGESRKTGKSIEDTVVGGIAGEFSGDDDLIKNNLFLAPSWFDAERIRVEENLFDLAILVFRGQLSQEIHPLDVNEVSPHGWMTIEEIQRQDPQKDPRIVRSFVHQIIDLEKREERIRRALMEFNKGFFTPVSIILPKDFKSARQFLEDREKSKDIIEWAA